MAAQDRRRHREQHVVSVGVVDQLGERERDIDDCLLVQERPSSQGWQLGWVTKKVAGASFSQPLVTLCKALCKVTFEEYPDVNYPTNCHGTFYLFSGQVRNKLLEVKSHWFHFMKSLLGPPTGFCGKGGENFQDR